MSRSLDDFDYVDNDSNEEDSANGTQGLVHNVLTFG